jgi:hypothetical protein
VIDNIIGLGALKEFQQALGCGSVEAIALKDRDNLPLVGDLSLTAMNALLSFIRQLLQVQTGHRSPPPMPVI